MTGGRNSGSNTGRRVFASSQVQHGSKAPRQERSNGNGGHQSGSRVYVGNLKFEVSWQDLKDHMKQAGRVLRADVMTDSTGRSKGCGIVEFASSSDARNAISTLNDTELDGRLIFVREDRESGSAGTAGEVSKRARPLRDQRDQREQRDHRELREPREHRERSHQAPVPTSQSRSNRSVYVGNLSWDVTWQDLKDHMRSLGGLVEHADVLTEPSGRSKGCGLVTFATVQDTEDAMDRLNNTELKGRPIFIREDREVGEASHGGNNRLYVGNLDYRTEWYELKDHFKSVGTVTRADVVKEEGSTRAKGYGIVEYASAEDAAEAVETLNNTQLLGRPLFVRFDREEKKRY